MKKEIDEGLRMLLAITKTSGNLGRNEQRKGTWDRGWGCRASKNSKQKCRSTTIEVHSNFTAAAFLLAWLIESYPFKRPPSAIAVVIRIQLPARFGNGQ